MEPDVLVATSDHEVRTAALRWCAAAGVPAQESMDLDSTRKEWRSASLILIGEDLALSVSDDPGCVRRDQVHLVVREPDLWWQAAVALGAADVLAIGDDRRALAGLGGAIDQRHEGCSLVVSGAGGGIGCSTFAIATALEAARRKLRAVALDTDICGSGIELIAGAEHAQGLRWTSLVDSAGRVAPGTLSEALPVHRGVATVGWEAAHRFAQLPEAAVQVWAAAVRAFDLVVVDQTGYGRHDRWEAAVLGGSVLTVMLVADDIAGVGAARRLIAHIEARSSALAAVVVRRRGGLGPALVEDTLGIPVISTLKHDRRVRTAVDQGYGPGRSTTLRKAARDVLDLVGLSTAGESS